VPPPAAAKSESAPTAKQRAEQPQAPKTKDAASPPADPEAQPAPATKDVTPKKTEPTPKATELTPKTSEPAAKTSAPRPTPPGKKSTPAVVIHEIGGKTLPQWIKEISSKDHSKGDHAIRMALGFGPERALEAAPALIHELKRRVPVDSVDATVALGLIVGGAAEPDPEIVRDAVAVLSRFLSDRQSLVQQRAAEALGKIGPAAQSALPPLLSLTRDPNSWEARQAATGALGNIALDHNGKAPPPPEVIARLKGTLSDPAAAVRLAAVKALASLAVASPAQQKLDVLRLIQASAASDTEEPVVRIWALVGVMHVSNEVAAAHVAALTAFLKHHDIIARVRAANALAFIGPKAKTAIRPLLAALDDKEEVVLAAIEALGRISTEPRPALPVLQEISLDSKRPPAIRQAAQRALDIISGKPAQK
jgi:HEAT repeat protein